MTRLDEIPMAAGAPADARPSAVVARLRAIRPSRRAILRGLVIGAAAAALVPIDWFLTRREAAAQPRTDGDDMSEHLTCSPESYREEANNWPATGQAVCYGGWRRGGFPCASGYHREGTYSDGSDSFESTRVTTSCNGRNAWRWQGYRCSDAITTATFADGTEYRGITIAACAHGEAEPTRAPEPASEPARAPEPTSEPARAPESGSGGSGPRETADPSRPRRLLPALGTGLSSLPVIGSLHGR
jgi:hypothetical protein